METWSALALGFGLGLRHATDADHVAMVATLTQRSPGLAAGARIAALWGLGHSLTFVSLGLGLICFGLRAPPRFDQAADVLVGVMLLLLGTWHLTRRIAATPRDAMRPDARHGAAARPVLIGLVHGLAGSAGIALWASTTITGTTWAVAYLLLHALGTLLGMVLLTLVIAPPLAWTLRRPRWQSSLSIVAALLNLGLGTAFLWLAWRKS